MPRVLLVDDDPAFLRIAEHLIRRHGFATTSATSWAAAAAVAATSKPDVVMLDRDLDGVDGLALLPDVARLFPATPVVVATGRREVEDVVTAMRAGAFDYLGKPLDEGRLVATLTKAVEHGGLLRRLARLDEDGGETEFEGMVGASPAIRTVYEILRNVARTDVTVLVTGESGTGKELVAHALHRRSRRAAGPFVALNMASVPRDLLESTLFGHEKGSFTGAERKRDGAAGEAQGGTLFLDEIGEMPIELQSKLLRFLQEKVYRRVGGGEDLKADVRIVAATNRDPLEEVRAGRLRLDLYYRLAVVPIVLPSLAERRSDIGRLGLHFLHELSTVHGKSFHTIAADALARLETAPWPGNVRQLRHVVERAVVLYEGPVLTPPMLPPDLEADPKVARPSAPVAPAAVPLPPVPAAPAPYVPPSPVAPLPPPVVAPAPTTTTATGTRVAGAPAPEPLIVPLATLERQAIQRALEACGSPAEAAEKLGISAATMYRRIKEYGLRAEGVPPGE
ncbi:MAG: sigma-54-dependent Fis family transcriptional regulator [Planctomycetia bacterium]|nr:sigma-54-dependent Fis family transcriptional regulator [Planctomycetia bacterium]